MVKKFLVVGLVGGLVMVTTPGHAQPQPEQPELTRPSTVVFKAVLAAQDSDNPRRLNRVIGQLSRLLADDELPNYDRSIAHQLRGILQFRLGEDYNASVQDFMRAVELESPSYRSASLADTTVELLIALGRIDDALAFAVKEGEKFGSFERSADLLRAEILASRGQHEQALDAIGPVNEDDDAIVERKLRYAILLAHGRYDEAMAVLDTFSTDIFYDSAIKEQRAVLRRLRAEGAEWSERRREGMAFATRVDEVFQDAEPIKRVNPSRFERCIRRNFTGEVRVRVRFDVDLDGSTVNARVYESEDDCYDAATVKAVEKWKYKPALVDGAPARRPGVETTVVYTIG